MFHRDFLAPSGSGLGFRGLSPFFSFVSFLRNGAPNEVLLRMNVVETWFVAVWGLCWCNFRLLEKLEIFISGGGFFNSPTA